jgi:hypothetical protein
MSPKSDAPASIEQLVMEAEDLVILRRRSNQMINSAKTQRAQEPESENDHLDREDTVEGMDCRRDVYRLSLQSSSSTSHLLDSLLAQPENENENEQMLSEVDVDVVDAIRHRRQLFAGEDRSSNDGSQFSVDEHDDEEDEEDEREEVDGQLSEFWDQVSNN